MPFNRDTGPEPKAAAAAEAETKTSDTIVMTPVNPGMTSVTVAGTVYKASLGKTIKADVEHVAVLISHGFKFVIDEIEKL
ncbi:MAG: hypothetical protein ACREJM_14350 [Candidatus Saccharimonadales bacterium]